MNSMCFFLNKSLKTHSFQRHDCLCALYRQQNVHVISNPSSVTSHPSHLAHHQYQMCTSIRHKDSGTTVLGCDISKVFRKKWRNEEKMTFSFCRHEVPPHTITHAATTASPPFIRLSLFGIRHHIKPVSGERGEGLPIFLEHKLYKHKTFPFFNSYLCSTSFYIITLCFLLSRHSKK